MAPPAAVALLVVLLPATFSATASAAVVEHTFYVIILGAVSYMQHYSLRLLLVVLTYVSSAVCNGSRVLENQVGGMEISQLCMDSVIYTVNHQMPGPTIEVSEGDTLVVHVVNDSPYPMSMHW
jgi:laccase